MWPSAETASRIADIANLLLIASLVVGVVATVALVWASNKKEEYLRLELGARAADAAHANLQITMLDLQAKQLENDNLRLRKELGPRKLDWAKFLAGLRDQPSAPVSVEYFRDSPECFELAQTLSQALLAAGWTVTGRTAMQPPSGANALNPAPMSRDGQPSGVTVVASAITEAEAMATQLQFEGKPWVKTPFTVLSAAIAEGLGRVSGHAGGPNAPAAGTLRIVVAPRF